MRYKWFWFLASIVIALGLAACFPPAPARLVETATPPPADGPTDTPSPLPTPTWTPVPADTPTARPTEDRARVPKEKEVLTPTPMPDSDRSVLQALIAEAQKDLVERLSVDRAQIEVVSAEPVEWPDASLGCPEPGKMYAQVITPGYLIVLETDAQQYEYHTDMQQTVIFCDPQRTTPDGQHDTSGAVQQAKKDLADRLGVQIDRIAVVAVLRQEFSESAFHCQKTEERVAREESLQIIPGESILLSAQGHTYEYHASEDVVLFCRRVS